MQVLRGGSGFDRFDGNVLPHNHAICTACGKVADIASEIPFKADAEKSAEEESGFKIFSHRLDFYGICPECISVQESAGDEGERINPAGRGAH